MAQQQFHYQTYQPNRQSLPPSKQPKKSRRQPWVLLVVVLIILAGAAYGSSAIIKGVSSLPTAIASTVTAKSTPKTTIPSSLRQSISSIIAGYPNAQVGVALENITTGEAQTYGANVPYEAASTAKIITACAYYHLVETGEASLTTPMGGYNAGFQIQEMINQSDNDSWDMLVAAITDDGLQAYASSIGLDYKVDGNMLSPGSMATLLTKLYSGKLLNQADTAQLLSYMQNTNDEALIPAAVDSDITVYHKYGLLDGELHDVAILTKGSQSYALVIYTKSADDSDDPQRTQLIHQITKAVTTAVFTS